MPKRVWSPGPGGRRLWICQYYCLCVDHETSPHLKLRFDGSKYQNKSLLGSSLPDDEEDDLPHVVLALWTDIPDFPEGSMVSGLERIL